MICRINSRCLDSLIVFCKHKRLKFIYNLVWHHVERNSINLTKRLRRQGRKRVFFGAERKIHTSHITLYIDFCQFDSVSLEFTWPKRLTRLGFYDMLGWKVNPSIILILLFWKWRSRGLLPRPVINKIHIL